MWFTPVSEQHAQTIERPGLRHANRTCAFAEHGADIIGRQATDDAQFEHLLLGRR